jgi:hypothetical protein
LTALTVADLTLFFLGVVVSLAAALVWVFWEIGQWQRHRKGDRAK